MTTFQEWERQKGLIFIDADPAVLNDPIDEDEFYTIATTLKQHGVNWDDRIKFLQDNGYKLTRANMVDPNLSARPPEENQQ